MNRRLFILGLMLLCFCALQAQEWTVTWKVNGLAYTAGLGKPTVVQNGKKVVKLPTAPSIDCGKEFVGWTIQEYDNLTAPDVLFQTREYAPAVTSNVTYYAVFADKDDSDNYFDYTTNCCIEIVFVDGVVSLSEAENGEVLFIKNPDPNQDIFNSLIVKEQNANANWHNNHPVIFYENGGIYIKVDKAAVYLVEVSRPADGTYCEVNQYVQFTVADSCTIEYVGFDDDWCATIAPASQGGRHKIGDSFVIPQERPADPEGLGRSLIHWNTSNYLREDGETYQLGDTIIIKEDISLYPQWRWDIKDDTEAPYYDLPNTDIVIYPGKTLSIMDYYEANTIMLKGGLDESKTSYAMPGLYIDEYGLLLKYNPDNIVHFDLSINKDNYYPFAVPFPVLVSDIDYADPALAAASTYGTHYVIKRYDGALRAENGANRDTNWVQVNDSDTLQPGVGYIITAVPVDGKAVIRIPLEFSDDWTIDGEQSIGSIGDGIDRRQIDRSQISTIAHSGAAATAHPSHAGWNFIANPYLAKYDGSQIQNAPKYANIPTYNFSEYQQVPLSDVTLSPEYPFFVQVDGDATLNFATTGRRQAPASLRSTTNTTLQATLSLTPQDDQTADHTTILINDTYTPAYEINADLEKMFGSAYTTALYTLSQEHRLAYNALSPQDALTPIPLGFRAAQEGEYTITLDNPNDLDDIESINLFDAHTNQTINLLHFDYTFTTTRTQDDARFTVNFVSRSNTATDITDIPSPTTSTTKFIHNNQLYILKHGNIYNAQGQQIQ